MTTWVQLDPLFHPHGLGFLPDILRDDDKRTVREQLEDRYAHGGGWRPMRSHGFRLNKKTWVLSFPGDPPFKPAAMCGIGAEIVVFYPQCSLLLVFQPDDSWEVTRVD